MEFVIPRLWSRVKENYPMPGCISRVWGWGDEDMMVDQEVCPGALCSNVFFLLDFQRKI